MKSKRNYSIVGCALLAAFFQQSAMAAIVDFENTPSGTADPTQILTGNSYVNGDITFTSTETMQLVGVGLPRNAFVPNDNPGLTPSSAPTDFGNWFLTGDFIDNTNMKLAFGTALSAISFEIVDIDGSGTGGANHERFTFDAYYGGSLVGGTFIQATNATPDAQVDTVSFSGIGLFDEIRIAGTTPGGSRNIGWGIDNITTSEVPVPAAAWLFGSGLIALAGLKRRKR